MFFFHFSLVFSLKISSPELYNAPLIYSINNEKLVQKKAYKFNKVKQIYTCTSKVIE